MANNDLSGLSLSELKELGKKVSEQITVAERQEIDCAAEQIEAIARSLNITAQELIERSGLSTAKVKRGPKPGAKGVALYQNKQDVSKTWTGKGRQPDWIVKHLEGGGTLDDLKIPA